MSQTFTYPYTIGLHDSDAAGVVFSANMIRICHHAYEAMMEELGFSIGSLLKKRTLGLPVVHLEADFIRYLAVGDRVRIIASIAHIGESSYRVAYDVQDDHCRTCARAATVHVCVDPQTGRTISIPGEFRQALLRFFESGAN